MFIHYLVNIIILIGIGVFIYGWAMNIKLDLLNKHDKYDYVSLIGVLIMWLGILILSYIFLKPYLIQYIF